MGTLLTVMRTDGADGYLYQSFSTDDGWTWQGLKRTPIWGFPCHLLALRSGHVLCAYGYRREPFGVRAVLSFDGGRTWDMRREDCPPQRRFAQGLGVSSFGPTSG